jgi:hypothetical protein
VRRYGDYIKGKLKGAEFHSATRGLAEYVDRIKKAIAAKTGKAFIPMLQQFKGELVRWSSNVFQRSASTVGAAWMSRFGIWGWFQDHSTGECYQS